VDIAAGGAHSCAFLGSGETLCWGENGSGQLGDGTNTDRSVPTIVSDFDGRDVAAGGFHSCAIEGESVWCWGENQQGQLGAGDTSDRNFPSVVTWP
jgi:alpha-tubulin suppressor-like RCC1 family protein